MRIIEKDKPLDLRSDYYQVRIIEKDKQKTTCMTRYGTNCVRDGVYKELTDISKYITDKNRHIMMSFPATP